MQTLLIVDDEKSTRDGLRMALEERFDCYVAADKSQAIEVLKNDDIDLLLTDLRLGGDNGMELLEEARSLPQPPLSIMMTAYGSVDTAVEAMRRGAWNFVTKPLNLDEVEVLLLRAAKERLIVRENHSLKRENQDLREKKGKAKSGLDRLIGTSPAMQKVAEIVEQVAPSKATVLIEGESGTGKELVAHALHDLSPRSDKKLVIVNCAALSPQLLESELFGHEKGAFTGATQKRIGRFEEANGGTLFLDEIGEIDPALQVKLLRALSEKTIERVGSNTPIKVDVRIIAATNKNLTSLVNEGIFREDLFYRLNVVYLNMPPLRERDTDIVILADNFLKEFNAENNKALTLAEQSLKALQAHEWPGNVRELRTAIEHGVILSKGSQITLNQLPSQLSKQDFPSQGSSPKDYHGFNLQSIEQDTIKRALKETSGNRTKASELLGISRRTLQRKLNQSPV